MSSAWMRDGKCYGTSMDFFPARGQNIGPIRAFCSDCPVRRQCAEFAIWGQPDEDTFDHGVWGGLSVDERKAVRRGHADLDEILAAS